MKNITLRIPEKMNNYLKKISKNTNISKSEVIRRALDEYISKEKYRTGSFLDLASDLKGSIEAPHDLSVNDKHFKGYGE
ncbi:MAG: ribbon-helix-helix domain-containing protein [Candidatus Marinimicrobia bacterium]|nr:ribbon-helix-helix domain-containing protein [Candidatus Neomarinimicrobiota bacterium]